MAFCFLLIKESLPQSWKKFVLFLCQFVPKKSFCASCSEGQLFVLVPVSLPSQDTLLLRNICLSIQLDVPMHILKCKLELDKEICHFFGHHSA